MKKLAIMVMFALLFAAEADAADVTCVYFTMTGAGTGDGLNWTNASSDLAGYLNSVSNDNSLNVEVWVAAGEYSPGPESTDTFVLTKGVKMYGGFKGEESETSRNDRDWKTNITILSCDGTPRSVAVVTCIGKSGANATPADTVLDGFTITGGNNTPEGVPGYGGGMYNNNSSAAIRNCSFIGNTASYGGGMYNKTSSPAVENCTFSGNTAKDGGGGMASVASSPTAVNSIFWDNAVPEIDNDKDSSATLKNCVVKDGFEGGTDIITEDPKLLSADILGKVTTDDAKFYIYKPDAGSSAINAGLPVGTVVSGDVKVPDKDQLGKARAASAKVTIGSYEIAGGGGDDPDDPVVSGDSPVDPITPPKAPEDAKNIEALSPKYTILSSDASDEQKKAEVEAAALLTSIPPDALEVGGNGAVRVKSDVARGLSKKVGVNAGKVVGIPVFSATLNTAGDVLMTAFKMSGAHLYADKAKDVKVMKILSESDSELFVYTDTPSEFGDRKFTVYRMNDTLVPKDEELDPSMNYKLVLFVKDTGEFDLNSADLHVSDPAAVLEEKSGSGGGGSSGCTAAYAPFALLLALPLFFIRKK